MPYVITVNPPSASIYEDQVIYLVPNMLNGSRGDYLLTSMRSNVTWFMRQGPDTDLVGEGSRGQNLRIAPLELGWTAGTYVIYAHGVDPINGDNGDSPDVTITVKAGPAPRIKVWAISGFASDIQAAIDFVVATTGVGDVFVPEGDFPFLPNVNVPGGVNLYGLGADKTILRAPTKLETGSAMIRVDPNGLAGTRIAKMNIIGFMETGDESVSTTGISLTRAPDFRIHHCDFANHSGAGIMEGFTIPFGFLRGVIDHCNIDNPYKDIFTGSIWGYGISPQGNWHVWENDITRYLGKYEGTHDVTYIENCNFTRCRHAIASNVGAWYVARHCTFTNPRPYGYAMVDVHGCYAPTMWCSDWNSGNPSTDRATCISKGGTWYKSAAGGRGAEIYDNTITGEVDPVSGTNYSVAIQYRGGGGVVARNNIRACGAPGIVYYWGAVMMLKDTGNAGEQSCENPERLVNQLYIWGNTFTGCPRPIGDDGTLTAGVDYFVGVADPNWTPYVYPHPYTLEVDPTPPPVVASPTAMLQRRLATGSYEISVPATVESQSRLWTFSHWSDDPTPPYQYGRTRSIEIASDTTISTVYEEGALLATVVGKVLDDKNVPLFGAVVVLNGHAAATDVNGNFTIESVLAQTYNLSVSAQGFNMYTQSVDASAGGTITVSDITLTASLVNVIYVGVGLLATALVGVFAFFGRKKKS